LSVGPEAKLQQKVVRYLKTLGSNVWYFKSSDRYTVGIPDLIICYNGRFIAIELKALKGVVSRIQSHQLSVIQRAGGESYICRTIEQVKQALHGDDITA
jgi:Holliday junction resolvase